LAIYAIDQRCCEFDEKITPITTWCVEQGIIKQPKQVGNNYNHKQK